MAQIITLPTTQLEGQATVAAFQTAATLLSIPSSAKPWAKAVFRHTGTQGFWYGNYAGGTPTATAHDFVLTGGEPHQLDCPPIGAIRLLASADANGPLDYSVSYAT